MWECKTNENTIEKKTFCLENDVIRSDKPYTHISSRRTHNSVANAQHTTESVEIKNTQLLLTFFEC